MIDLIYMCCNRPILQVWGSSIDATIHVEVACYSRLCCPQTLEPKGRNIEPILATNLGPGLAYATHVEARALTESTS